MLVFPLFGLDTTLGQNLAIGAIFTVVSLVRSYLLRRVFEMWGRDLLQGTDQRPTMLAITLALSTDPTPPIPFASGRIKAHNATRR